MIWRASLEAGTLFPIAAIATVSAFVRLSRPVGRNLATVRAIGCRSLRNGGAGEAASADPACEGCGELRVAVEHDAPRL